MLGPLVTLGPGATQRIARAAWRKLNGGSIADSEHIVAFENLLGDTDPSADVRAAVRGALTAEHPSGQVSSLSHNRWAAVLSLSLDLFFETSLRDWCGSHPSPPTVTIIQDLRKLQLPPRTIPVYKMVGSIFAQDFPLTATELRIRKSLWPPVLRAFAEAVKGSAVLCMGFGEDVPLLVDLLAPMVATSTLAPGPLILLADDPVGSNASICELVGAGLNPTTLSRPRRDAATQLAEADPLGL